MKIAIIGTGISGLTSAYLLSQKHDVHVFEANDYIGGHTHTLDVEVPSGRYAIDTGFIVFNDWTYPNFIKLMTRLGVAWCDSSMSFSVKAEENGLEYNGTSLNSLFAQRSNFFKPRFHRMIQDILRFNRESVSVLETKCEQSLDEYLKQHGYSDDFKRFYIVPMGAAIWSSSVEQMENFPIEYFVRFFKNHGMLSVSERPVWKVIQGGSRSYLDPITSLFYKQIHLKSPVLSVNRQNDQVAVVFRQRGEVQTQVFDHVIFASHADQTLAMLKDATALEREVLEAFEYQPNETLLHTDQSVLPARKLAWAAWNYWVPSVATSQVAVTYNMNILQGIRAPETFCVSLNMGGQIDPSKVLVKQTYHHPVYSASSFGAQKRWAEVSGVDRIHFCGAYWGYGFHEDGVKSALRVCESFGEYLS